MLHLIHWIMNYRHGAGYRIDRPDGNDMYSILLFRDPLEILQDGHMVTAPKNSCLIYDPFAPQLYYNEVHPYHHDGVFFRGEDLHPLLEKLGLPVNRIFQVVEPFAVSSGIQNIASEAISHRAHSPNIIDLRLHDLIYTIADSLDLTASTAQTLYHEMSMLRREILLTPERQWDIESLAEKLSISVSYFQHQYKSFFHISLRRELIAARQELAKYLLQSTNASVAKVAEQSGYNSTEHFIRQFQSYNGMSPTHYRAGKRQ